MAAPRTYTKNRSEAVARIFGEPMMIILNDGAPFRCVSGFPASEIQARAQQAAREADSDARPIDYTTHEWALMSLIDPEDRERFHAECHSTDPALLIVTSNEMLQAILGDLLEYLAGGVPFEPPAPSSSTPSTTGGNSAPSSVQIG